MNGCKVSYEERFSELSSRFINAFDKQSNTSRFLLVNSTTVNNETEALEFFHTQLDAGEEGAVVKNIGAVWQPRRTKDLGKMKAEADADLLVTGWKEGTGKFVGMVGSLECATADGKLVVNVSGFSDEVRSEAHTLVGKIITVKYNAVIKDKNSDTHSLFLPRFEEVRFDKTAANNFEDLK